MDQALGHGLRADVHKPPLGKFIVLELQFAAVQGSQDILRPRYQQPYDRALLAADRLQDRLGTCSFQDYSFAAGDQAAEPVHLRTGMVQRRNAQETVILCLAVMCLLHPGGMDQAAVLVKDRFRESGGTG